MKAPENVGGITLFYIKGVEKMCEEQRAEILNLRRKNTELSDRIEQYKSWLQDSCSCKGE